MAAAMAAAMPLDRAAGPFAVPAAFAAADPTLLLPTVPRAPAPLKFSAQTPSTIIKGCWQLSGGHRGDPASDRTSGAAAVDDFASFVAAGIDTFDTGPEACGYGPSELVIGEVPSRLSSRGHTIVQCADVDEGVLESGRWNAVVFAVSLWHGAGVGTIELRVVEVALRLVQAQARLGTPPPVWLRVDEAIDVDGLKKAHDGHLKFR